MTSIVRTHMSAAAAGALLIGMTLVAASPAAAQQQNAIVSAPAPAPAADQGGQASSAGAPFWELIGGYEADTHGSAYGFFGPGYVHPINSNVSWTGRAFGNYLAYEFTDAGGETKVRSPGVSASLGLRFGGNSWFGVNAGPDVRWRRFELTRPNGQKVDTDETSVGANIGAEAYVNPTSHNNIHGIVNYGTVDKYTWARLGFKERVAQHGSTSTYLGVEGIAQGNEDIRSTQFGGFFELNPTNLSLMFRVGYKRSTFDVGPNKTGPYFAIGFYKRLG